MPAAHEVAMPSTTQVEPLVASVTAPKVGTAASMSELRQHRPGGVGELALGDRHPVRGGGHGEHVVGVRRREDRPGGVLSRLLLTELLEAGLPLLGAVAGPGDDHHVLAATAWPPPVSARRLPGNDSASTTTPICSSSAWALSQSRAVTTSVGVDPAEAGVVGLLVDAQVVDARGRGDAGGTALLALSSGDQARDVGAVLVDDRHRRPRSSAAPPPTAGPVPRRARRRRSRPRPR